MAVVGFLLAKIVVCYFIFKTESIDRILLRAVHIDAMMTSIMTCDSIGGVGFCYAAYVRKRE